MVVRAEIYDWNGTIDSERNEDRYLRYVLQSLLSATEEENDGAKVLGIVGSTLNPDQPQLSLNLTIKPAINLYDVISLVETIIPSYPASRSEGIDYSILDRARKAQEKGIVTGIVSASWTDLITTILQDHGYLENNTEQDAFNFIIANNVHFNLLPAFPKEHEDDPKAYHRPYIDLNFRQNVYGRKGKLLRALFGDGDFPKDELHVVGSFRGLKDINLSEVAYIGDSFDDESAFDAVGYPTLALDPDPLFAAHANEKYGNRLFTDYKNLATHWSSRGD